MNNRLDTCYQYIAINIRTETPEDVEAVGKVNIGSLGRENEANLDLPFSVFDLGTVQSKNRSQSRFALESNSSQSLAIEF